MSSACWPTSSRTRISAATSSERPTRRVAVLALAGAAALAIACGKKGPPQPPVRVTPAPPGPLKARQIGPDVVLAATLPGTRSNGTKLDPGAELRVLRMPATESLRPGAVSDRYLVVQFEKAAKAIVTLSGPALDSLVLDGRFLFVDHEAGTSSGTTTPPGGGPPPGEASTAGRKPPATHRPAGASPMPGAVPAARMPRFLYALQVVEPQKRKSPLRAPVLLEVCKAPVAPIDLQVETAEGEVRLDWRQGGETPAEAAPASPATAPAAAGAAAGAAGATPAAPQFNLYRKELDHPRDPETPLNPKPLTENGFIDRSFRYDVDYVYFVRTVNADPASLCESVASPAVEVRPHDRFAPAAPTGLAVAAEGNVIRIYWFPNGEPDLAGYRVYRREGDAAEAAFLGEVPASETSYIDSEVKGGVRYHYSVSAVDSASPVNESPRSEERSELLSPAPASPTPPGGG